MTLARSAGVRIIDERPVLDRRQLAARLRERHAGREPPIMSSQLMLALGERRRVRHERRLLHDRDPELGALPDDVARERARRDADDR